MASTTSAADLKLNVAPQRMHILHTQGVVLQAGLSLSMRNVLSIVILLVATTMVTGLGSVALAAHEILRQAWIFAIQ